MGTQATIISRSESGTGIIAAGFTRLLHGGEFISLEGNLGAGKTFFARALARSLGVQGSITSPTFVLQKIYDIPLPSSIRQMKHYDLYRLDSLNELVDLGFYDADPSTIVVAEWGDKFFTSFPEPLIRIRIDETGDDQRELNFMGLTETQRDSLVAGLNSLNLPTREVSPGVG